VIRGFSRVNIDVEDVDASRAFYAALGLREIPRGEGREREGAWFEIPGGVQLHLSLHPGCSAANRASKRHFCIVVDDLDRLRKTLPEIQDKGTRIFARDPSGNRIEIQPSEPQ
jgi:catechol 2,3-dioxygenase-like lactoylglutathione lyase family enzyme